MKLFNMIITALIYLFFFIGGEVSIWMNRGNDYPVAVMLGYGLMFLVILIIILEVWGASDQDDDKMIM